MDEYNLIEKFHIPNTQSRFSSIHPLPCFIYYIGGMALSMTIFHPIFLLSSGIIAIVINYIVDKGKNLKKSLKFYIFIGVLIVVINPLISNNGETILFYLFNKKITLESFVYGMTMMFSLLTILTMFLSFNEIISQDKFLYLFSNISPNVSLLLMMTIRFVPLLKKRIEEIIMVQKTKGIDLKSGKMKDRAKNSMKIMNILLSWSLEESIDTAKSMKARGYGIEKNRSFYHEYKMDVLDWTLLVFILTIIFILLFLWHRKYISFQIYPLVDKIYFGKRELFAYLLFIIYFCIPIGIEGIDRLKWH